MKIILQVVDGGFILNVEGSEQQYVCRTYDLMKKIRSIINAHKKEDGNVDSEELPKQGKVHKRRV